MRSCVHYPEQGYRLLPVLKKIQIHPFLKSRYISSTVTLPGKTDSTRWVEYLGKHLDSHSYDLVIPPDDYTSHAIHENRWLLEKARINLPSHSSWDATYNKEKTFELARELGISVPDSLNISSEQAFYDAKLENETFPIVVKPLNSKAKTESGMIWLKHDIVQDYESLKSTSLKLLRYSSISIQKYCTGVGYGHGVLAHEGKVLADCEWIRVHEPAKGGASSYRKSVTSNQTLRESSIRLIEALNWTGVAMIEYRYDPADGKYWIMEVNGRFWGSLPLAIEAGMDFPLMLYQAEVEEKRDFTEVSYRPGIYCRNLQKDVNWMLESFVSKKASPAGNRTSFGTVLGELGHIFTGKEKSDEFHLDDPLPGLTVIARSLGDLVRKASRKIFLKAILGLMRSGAWLKLDKHRFLALTRIYRNQPFLFLCFGNICRSPFAEASWNAKALSNNLQIKGVSAGIVQSRFLVPPDDAVSAATAYGLKLQDHMSQKVTPELLKSATVIMCMDLKNQADLVSQYPSVFYKCFLLGNFSSQSLEIADPFRLGRAAFDNCYRQIDEAVNHILTILPGRKS